MRVYELDDLELSITLHKIYDGTEGKKRTSPEYNPLKGDLISIIECISDYYDV